MIFWRLVKFKGVPLTNRQNISILQDAMRIIFLLTITFLFTSCTDVQRDNPYDSGGNNYQGDWWLSSSSFSGVSSSSATPVVSNCTLNGGTVKIGEQVWMKENLNCNVSGSKCYNDNESNCATYGRLYNWVTAMNLPSNCNSSSCSGQVQPKHQGICPSGWHIPSDAEWTTLTDFVSGSSTAGTKLKSSDLWNSYSGIPKGTDDYGFAALPGGYGYSGGLFNGVGNLGYWWSATEDDADYAYYRSMNYYNEDVSRGNYDESSLFSVRCLQD